MSDELEATVDAVIGDVSWGPGREADRIPIDRELWQRLRVGGYTAVGVPEAVGGAGGDLADAAVVVRLAARKAASLPLLETLIEAGYICSVTGLTLPEVPTAVVGVEGGARQISVHRDGAGSWTFEGRAARVPWAGAVDRLVVLGRSGSGELVVAIVEGDAIGVVPGANLAGEPRDDVALRGLTVPADDCAAFPVEALDDLEPLVALGRSVQIAGALEGVLALTVQYAKERTQFNRPIGRFQAVQQHVAALAGETASAVAIADAAVRAWEAGRNRELVAAAKIRTGLAAGKGARLAHQVHGAIGYSREHRLQTLTRRLWSWRDEGGAEEKWAAELGHSFVEQGAERVWGHVTSLAGVPR